MRKKSKKWSTIADAIGGTAKHIGLAKKMQQYAVWNRWNAIMGPLISSHACPARWLGNTLVVAVEHPSWMQQLSYLKSNLIEKLKENLPSLIIKDIRFEIGKIEDIKIAETPKQLSRKLSKDERDFITQVTDEIKDEKMRKMFHELMEKDFGKKRLKL